MPSSPALTWMVSFASVPAARARSSWSASPCRTANSRSSKWLGAAPELASGLELPVVVEIALEIEFEPAEEAELLVSELELPASVPVVVRVVASPSFHDARRPCHLAVPPSLWLEMGMDSASVWS